MFNWHKESGSFLQWMVVNLVAGNRELFEELSAATNKFTEVDLDIRVNGVKVKVDDFVESVKSNMDALTKQEAARIVRDSEPLEAFMAHASKLSDDLSAVNRMIKDHVNKILEEMGIDTSYLDE